MSYREGVIKLRRILGSALVIAGVTALGVLGTYAFFSDTETSNANQLNAGVLKIDVNDNNSTGTFDITLGTVTGLMPDEKTGTATVTVKNTGDVNTATFGRFTLSGDEGVSLDDVLKFYNYKVEYFNADGTPAARWSAPNFDPYYGEAINQDWFIKNGETSLWTAVGGATLLGSWVYGNGVLDVPGNSWDMEALKPGEYYTVTFQFQMDPLAGNEYQGEDVTLGYVVRATQINTSAIVGLGLGGLYNDSTYVDPNVTPYLLNQVAP